MNANSPVHLGSNDITVTVVTLNKVNFFQFGTQNYLGFCYPNPNDGIYGKCISDHQINHS